MFSYDPLWKMLIDKKMTKTDLLHNANLTFQTIVDMGKNKFVSMATLNKICNTLHCEISDVIKHFPDES